MTDIALRQIDGRFDIALDGPDLATDDGLKTAVILSLHLDARADGERGWWADALDTETPDTGSLLWQLERTKTTQATLNTAHDTALEALQWLIDDGIARQLQIEAMRVRQNRLYLEIHITRADGSIWAMTWDATELETRHREL